MVDGHGNAGKYVDLHGGMGSNRRVSSILTEGLTLALRVEFSGTGLGWVFSTNSTLKNILIIDFLRKLKLCEVNSRVFNASMGEQWVSFSTLNSTLTTCVSSPLRE